MDKYCVGKWIPTYRPAHTIRLSKYRRIKKKRQMKKNKMQPKRYGNHNGVYEGDTLMQRIGLLINLILLLPIVMIMYIGYRIIDLFSPE